MRTTAIAAGFVTLVFVLSLSPAPHAQETPILSAMRDEMARSMADLRMKGEPAPYYIEYEIDDISSMRAIARLGGVVDDVADHSRTLRVQVRVGDYQFDSSRFVTQDRGAAGAVASCRCSARRSLRRHPARDLARDRHGLQARPQPFREEESGLSEPGVHGSDTGFLARNTRADRPAGLGAGARRSPVGRSREAAVRRLRGDPGRRLVGGVDLRGPRYELLPEQRRVQGRHARLDRVPPHLRGRAGRRWDDRAGRVRGRRRPTRGSCRRCRSC